MIYLDNAATTFPKPESLYKALDYANRNLSFNAGRGLYKQSTDAFNIIKDAKKAIADLGNTTGDNIAFFSSATETLNIIINGIEFEDGDNVYVSPFEHNAIIRPLFNIKNKKNINIIVLPFNETTWEPDIPKIKNMFAVNCPKAIFISQISNVTGFIVPCNKIFELGKNHSSINIIDCAQGYGLVDFDKQNVDFAIFAGHKSLYAGFGIAGFINYSHLNLVLTKTGGNGSDSLNHFMPIHGNDRYESGSQNVVAAYGLLESIKWLNTNKQKIIDTSKTLAKKFIGEAKNINGLHLYLPPENLHSSIISFTFDGYRPEDVASILNDEYKICVRSGYHCAPFVHKFLGTEKIGGTIRVSIGAFNTIEDIVHLVDALKTL